MRVMSPFVFPCIRCGRQVVPDLTAVCSSAPDGGPHEALPSAFMPSGFPSQDDFGPTQPDTPPGFTFQLRRKATFLGGTGSAFDAEAAEMLNSAADTIDTLTRVTNL